MYMCVFVKMLLYLVIYIALVQGFFVYLCVFVTNVVVSCYLPRPGARFL